MEHNPTPEEQLLKLIENPAEPKTPPQPEPASKPKRGKFSFPFSGLFKRKASSEASPVSVLERNPFIYIKGINALLVLSVVASGLYLVLDMSLLKGDPKNFLAQISLNDSLYPIRDDQGEQTQRNVKYYHDLMDRRNPFLLMTEKQAPKEEEKPAGLSIPKPQSEKMAKLIQSIKLVGISWSGGNPLAMIEESETGKTYFLRQGQEINGLKVQSIDKEKAIVTYEGEETPLY